MNRQEFENKNSLEWQVFETSLDASEGNKHHPEAQKFPSRFRKVCYDLSLAQYRMFGHRVCDRLNALAIRGYRQIHRKRGAFGEGAIKFLLGTFPQTFRREWRLFVAVSMVFWIPFFAMWWSAEREIEWVQALLGQQQMTSIEGMYGKGSDPVEHLRQEHGSNFMMFAHYN